MSKYYAMVNILRKENINSEVYIGDSGLKSQLKYADKRNAPAVILCGENEFKENTITIKNLSKGKEQALKTETREEWKKSENIQITTSKENLVNEIKKLI